MSPTGIGPGPIALLVSAEQLLALSTAPAEVTTAPAEVTAAQSIEDRLAMEGVRHGIAWERRMVMFLIDSAIHHASGRPDAVEVLEQLKVSVEAYA